MRAREFVVEQRAVLDPSAAGPLQHTYIIPGIRNNDAYHTMRLGVAMARARAELGGAGDDLPPWSSESAFGQNAIVAGFNDSVEEVLNRALELTDTKGGKILVSDASSTEPKTTEHNSPVKPFAGYPR